MGEEDRLTVDADARITRPKGRMQWVTGTARIFVNINGQQSQVDLKRQGVEGQGVPNDLPSAVERLPLREVADKSASFLTVRYLAQAKLRAFMNRTVDRDYIDLRFACTDLKMAPQVREVAHHFDISGRVDFLDMVLERNPEVEAQVRWAFRLERESPEVPATRVTDKGE